MRYLATALVALIAAGAAAQNIQFGGSRSAGMGGAGLAYPQNIGQVRSNPALLGFEKLDFQFRWPTLGYHTRGIDYGDMVDFIGSIGGGGISVGKLGEFAKRFGDKEKSFGIYADMGVSFGTFAVGFGGDSLATTIPNASLRNKIAIGSTLFGPADAIDGYGYGYTSLDIAHGHKIQPRKDELQTLAVGGKLRIMSGYYTHYVASGAQITAGTGGAPAPEMNGSSVRQKTGIGLDVGMQAIAGRQRNLFYAATIENFIVPNLGFGSTRPFDSTSGTPGETTVSPFKQRWSVGAAYAPIPQVVLAADWVDLYNHRGEKEFRMGGEYMFTKQFGARLGFASRNGVTLGFTLAGFNFAISKRNPMQVATGFRF